MGQNINIMSEYYRYMRVRGYNVYGVRHHCDGLSLCYHNHEGYGDDGDKDAYNDVRG
jgi:hypothetical protein